MSNYQLTEADAARAYSALQSAVDQWDQITEHNSPETFVKYSSFKVKPITDELHNAIKAFLDATADSGLTVDPKAYETLIAADFLAAVYRRYENEMIERLVSPEGIDRLLVAWNRVKATRERAPLPPPRPISVLAKDGAPLHQIACHYGWYHANGEPDVNKVCEEMANPGTHYKPDEWVHPSIASDMKRLKIEWAGRSPRVKLYQADLGTLPEEPKARIMPIDELIRQGVEAPQIARMHGITVQQAQDLIDASGRPADRTVLPANQAVAHENRMERYAAMGIQ